MKTIALLLLLASQSGLRSTTLCTGTNPADCLPPPPICGNGIVHRIEACDDGNRTAGDGCSFMCGLEAGYACTGSPSSCGPDCGDSLLVGLETCDDGNEAAGDGCSATCTVESGWYCTGLPSSCTTTCGDGTKAGAEECDDGNLIDGDGCAANCTSEYADEFDVVALNFENNLVNSATTGGSLASNGTTGYALGRVGSYGLSVASGATRNMVYGMPGTTYNVPGNSWTMSVWVKLSAYGNHYNKIFDRKYTNDSAWGSPYVVQSIELYQSAANGKWASSNAIGGSWNSCHSDAARIPLNHWTHLAVTYNGTQQKLYQNGVLVNTCNTAGTTLMGTSGPFFLGANLWDSYFDQVDGVIDDARIANVVRSEAYIAAMGKIECGNGYLEGTEACDDGNVANGDGCSSTCTVE